MPDGTVAGAQAEGAEIPGRQPGAALVEGEYFFLQPTRRSSALAKPPESAFMTAPSWENKPMRMILVAAACCIALSSAAMAADAYKLDAKGKCHAADGKFAKQELCAAAAPAHTYKLDANKKCRDEKGKFAAANLCPA